MMDTAEARFAVFARAWSLAVLLGLVSQEMASSPLRVALCAVGFGLLVMPRPALLTAFAALYPLHWLVDTYAHDYIHTWLIAVFSSAIGLGLVTTARRDEAAWRRDFVAAFAPVAAVLAGIAFFATGFAKLNRDFSDPATSCGALFYAHQRTIPPFEWVLPAAPWAGSAAIRITQVAETLGALLVVAHFRTRKAGVLLSIGFLTLVGTNPVGRLYEFTAPFVALMLLTLTWEARARVPRPVGIGLAIVGGALLLAAMSADPGSAWMEFRYVGGRVAYGLLAVAAFAGVAASSRALPLERPVGIANLAWIPVVVLVLHETMPYQGLRSERNLTMAANFMVNTELSNHQVVRGVPRLPWNRLAVLERSSDPALNKRGKTAWVDWRLFDYLGDHPDISVTFTIDGETTTLARAGDDPRAKHSWIAHHLGVVPTTIVDRAFACGGKKPPK